MILKCYETHTRAVCIREVQKSIKDSVKQLLEDKIQSLGLGQFFEVLDQEIRGRNGSLIIFRGMASYNAETIKSLEAYDIAWVEEAQTLSQYSLDLLRPTMRKQGSELWFSWNPRFKTDPVDVFFRKEKRDNAIAVHVNWTDNPWFKDTDLYNDMIADYAADPDKAEHVWGGAYGSSQGAVLSRFVSQARREGRVNETTAYDPHGAPIEISSDLGFHDTACWWFWQRKVGGFSLIGYRGQSGLDADEWCGELNEYLSQLGVRPSHLGKIWLPHDAKAKTFQSKYSSVERFVTTYGPDKISIVPISRKADQISAARMIIQSCAFNKDECEQGLDGLEAWEFDYNEDTQEFSREPKHNWASHPSDAFAYGCQIMRGLAPKPQEPRERWTQVAEPGAAPHPNQVRLQDLWKTANQPSRRI
jgi:phage terminase large subunit